MNENRERGEEGVEKESDLDPTRNDTDTAWVDDVSTEVQHIIQAIKHPDASVQMQESRESVFGRINQKIESDLLIHPANPTPRIALMRYLSIASVVALLLVSVATLSYFRGYRSGTTNLSQTLVEVAVPLGTISHLVLSDGTKVTLNGGSTFTYPALFATDRQVTLVGEGFFDVAKETEKPFIVHTANLSAKVLGTRFGFKAYKEDAQTVLTLEEGSVNALPFDKQSAVGILLHRDQQLVIDNETKEFQRRNVNVHEYVSWKDGVIIFRDQTLTEIAVILERRFDLKINIRSESIKNDRYVAQFKYGENVEQILDKLSYKRAWTYEKQQGIIEIVQHKTNKTNSL